jgi:hypothetical protein
MIPHFVATARNSFSALKFLPPDGFTAAGSVSRAEFSTPIFARGSNAGHTLHEGKKASTGVLAAKRAGLRFESKMQFAMAALLPQYLPGPWLQFWTHLDDRSRVCQPDGIVEFPSSVLIVEIKSQHCERAWWQLRMLYQPVIERALGKKAVVLEVAAKGDMLAPFPEPVKMVLPEHIEHWARSGTSEFLLCFSDSFKEHDDGQ